MCLTGNPWQYASPEIHWDVPDKECTSSLGIEMCLMGNAHSHLKGGCASPRMGMHLTKNAHPDQECISLLGMYIVYTC